MFRQLIGHRIVIPKRRRAPYLFTPNLRCSSSRQLLIATRMVSTEAWHRRLDVGDVPTDVWGLDPPPATPAQMQILVIPGNPGLGSYYLPFMTALKQHLDVAATIRTLSHAGQDTHRIGNGYSLQEQVQHKLGPDAPPLLVAGHSIGAYMAAHAVRTIEQADGVTNITCVAALFPFFAVDPTSHTQRRLRWLVQRPGVAGAVVGAAGWLPLFLRRALVSAYGGLDDEHALQATLTLLTPHQVLNAFTLGQHEFRDLDGAVDWPLLRELGQRLLVVAAPKDVWLPDEQWRAMEQELPEAQRWWEEGQVHAFCVSANRSDALAQKLARHVHHARAEAIVEPSKATQHLPPVGLPM